MLLNLVRTSAQKMEQGDEKVTEDRKVLFFRHFEKQYANGKSKTYKFDPDILREPQNLDRRVAAIVKKYGVPHKIVTSPFRRCRSSASSIKRVLGGEGFEIVVEINRDWGEYLGNQSQISTITDFTPETAKEDPIIETNWNQFLTRIQSLSVERGVWYITHKLTIEQFGLRNGKKYVVGDSFYGYEF